jgi:hypothetical protein
VRFWEENIICIYVLLREIHGKECLVISVKHTGYKKKELSLQICHDYVNLYIYMHSFVLDKQYYYYFNTRASFIQSDCTVSEHYSSYHVCMNDFRNYQNYNL